MRLLSSPISCSHFEVGSSSLKQKREIDHVETLSSKCPIFSPISSPHFKVGSITSLKWSQEIDYADKHKLENNPPESPSVKCLPLMHSLSEVLSPCLQITSYTSKLKRKLEDNYANNSPSQCPAIGSCSVAHTAPVPEPHPVFKVSNTNYSHSPTHVEVQIEISILMFPNELLHQIITFLNIDGLRTCTKVSILFREISGPYFLATVKFKPSKYWLTFGQGHHEVLLVWRGLNSFIPPLNFFFNANKDAHLLALDIFLQTLQTTDGLCFFLSCTGNIISSSLMTIMKSMAISRCCHISFSHSSIAPLDWFCVRFPRTLRSLSSKLEVFWVDTNCYNSFPLSFYSLDCSLSSSTLLER